MKNKLIIFFLFVFATNLFANSRTDVINPFFYAKKTSRESASFQLIKDIQLNLEKEFYSLVIAGAEELEREYPNSKFVEEAKRYKAESLYFLGRSQDAKTLLNELKNHSDVSYFKARIFFDEQDYNSAVKKFYDCVKLLEKNSSFNNRYFSALYFSAKSYNILGEYKKSLPILLSLIEEKGYLCYQGEVFFLLSQCFFENKKYDQVCNLFEKTESLHNYIGEKYLRKILLLTASSYDSVGNSEKAQTLYTKIATDYDIQGLGLSEFWVRSGIESFEENDFSDALRCFEVAKSTENLTETLQDIILIYNAAIKAKSVGYSQAVNFLEENSVKNKKYLYIILCAYSAKAQNYQKSIFYGENLLKENFELSKDEEQVLFWYAYSLLKTQQNEKSLQIINKISESSIQVETLKAKVILDKNRFSEIYKKNQKNEKAFENFIIANLTSGQTAFFKEFEFSNKSKNNLLENLELKNYFLGIASYLESDWNSCISFMDEHLKKSCQKQEFAKFYKAYSLYMLQENQLAYELFMEAQKNLNANSKFEALFLASQCALSVYNQKNNSSLWLEKAIQASEESCKLPVENSLKIDCLIFLSQLYSLDSDYEKAITLIQPYSTKNDETSLKCLYVLANLYKQVGNIEKANSVYQQLAQRYPETEIAQESIFMQGKLFYENNLWGEASDKFAMYRKTYPNGKYYLQVCYYNGIALKNLGNDSLAILLLQECADSEKNTEFAFISLIELMELYRQRGDYENAVNTGNILLKKYPEQAKENNIKKSIEEIVYLASGEDEKTAILLASFAREGRMTTLQGRKAGFELGQNYISVLSSKEEGAKLLQEFVLAVEKSSTKTEEIENLANAYYLLGTYHREKLQYQKSSSHFLLSAQYFASFNKDSSARALYGAIESFDCNSNFADSKQTYFTLKEKYPNSQWTQRAFSLVSEYLEQ